MKKLLFRILTWRPLNYGIRVGMRPFLPLLPYSLIAKMPVVGTITRQLPDGKAFLYHSDGMDTVAGTLYWYGVHGVDGSSTRLFAYLLDSCSTVLDIGANTGLFSVIAGVHDRSRKVYAFEPVPSVCGYLRRNLELNRLPNAKAYAYAVSNHNGEIPLYIESGLRLPLSASTSHEFRAEVDKPLMVRSITVDDFVREQKISKVDLIKVDTETTEPEVLEGAAETLRRDRPFILCEVLPGTKDMRLHQCLDHLNYQYYLITGSGLMARNAIEGDSRYSNYLFVPQEKEYVLEAMIPAKRKTPTLHQAPNPG